VAGVTSNLPATEAQRRESHEAPPARRGTTEAQRRESHEAPQARRGTTEAQRRESHEAPPARRGTGDGVTELRENLSGPYSWETLDDTATPAVISLQREIRTQNQLLYYGDTCLQGKEGLRVL